MDSFPKSELSRATNGIIRALPLIGAAAPTALNADVKSGPITHWWWRLNDVFCFDGLRASGRS
jgi:hypothetical protein